MSLSDSDRRLARLFAACVLGRWDVVREVRKSAVTGEPDRRWRETLLMVHVFAGVPRAVESYGVIDAAGGLGPLDADEMEATAGIRERGERMFETVYGARAPEVRALLMKHHPVFAHAVLEESYGRILTRLGLSADRRELLACAALTVLGQERQLAAHARGAVRCGARKDEVLGVIECVADLAGPQRTLGARLVVRRFTKA